MEEECGNQEICLDILQKGLKFNKFNENLFVKAIKTEERLGNIEGVRLMIKAIQADKAANIDKVWRLLLEGALFEGRCGNHKEAREQFGSLLKRASSYGPVFLEASKYEERENDIDRAIYFCEEGLEYNVKYNPLWFQYLRLYEKADDQTRT